MRIYKLKGYEYGIEYDDGTRQPVGTRLKTLALYRALNPPPPKQPKPPRPARTPRSRRDGKEFEARAPRLGYPVTIWSTKQLTHCVIYKRKDRDVTVHWTSSPKAAVQRKKDLLGWPDLEWIFKAAAHEVLSWPAIV